MYWGNKNQLILILLVKEIFVIIGRNSGWKKDQKKIHCQQFPGTISALNLYI